MLRNIIFDLDGTIGDTLPLCIAAFQRSIEPLAGRTVSEEEIVATFGPSEEGTIRKLIPDFYQQGVESYLKHYVELHGMCRSPFPGMQEVLDAARRKNIRLSMVTGKGARSTEITLNQFGIRHYFESIETGSPEGPRKAEGIANVLSQLSLPPEQCIYVGDAPSDIAAARACGVPAIAAAWANTADKERLLEMRPDRLFTNIPDFLAYIEEVSE